MKPITLKMLDDLGACEYMRDRFYRTFGQGVEVTVENVVKAQNANLPLYWLAAKVFDAHQRRVFYDADYAAQDKYDEVTELSREKCDKVTSAMGFTNQEIVIAVQEHDAVCEKATNDQHLTIAKAFVEAWQMQFVEAWQVQGATE